MNEIDPSKPVVCGNAVGRVICCDLNGDLPLVVAWTEKGGNEYINLYTLDGRVDKLDTKPTIKNQEVEEWRVVYKSSPDQKEITGFDHYVGTMSFPSEEVAKSLMDTVPNDAIGVVRVK